MEEIISNNSHKVDQMYKKSNQTTWHQDEQRCWLTMHLSLELHRKYSPFDYLCDFKSGLQYSLDILQRELEQVVNNIDQKSEINALLRLLSSDFVGKDVILNSDLNILHFNLVFEPLKTFFWGTLKSSGNDNWFMEYP